MELKYTTKVGKDLLTKLRCIGLEYGAVHSVAVIREQLGITVPEIASQKEFNKFALYELAATDYVRNVLLGEGKYFTKDGDAYRVLLPSENEGQVERYMCSADTKLRRAIKLLRNTPKDARPNDALAGLLYMKKSNVLAERKRRDLLS